MKYKILIVEGGEFRKNDLKETLESCGYQVVGLHDNATSVYELLRVNPNVDLVLIDISVKGEQSGIDFAKWVRKEFDIPIVFNARYFDDDTVLQSFDIQPDGYIVQPYSRVGLSLTLKLALLRFERKSKVPNNNISIQIRDKGYSVLLESKDIVMAQADGLYTKITTTKKSYMIRDILKNFEGKLPAEEFIRIHKSYVVNKNFIESFNSKKLLINNQYLPIRRGLYTPLKEILNRNLKE